MFYLIVDTETTGLPRKGATSALTRENVALYPDLIEPAFGVWDTERKRFVAFHSCFVPWPDFTPFEGTFHAENNMAWEHCVLWAKKFETAWRPLLAEWLRQCDAFVAYNAQFDYKVLAKSHSLLRHARFRTLCVSETMRILNGHRIPLGKAYEYLHDGQPSPYPPHFALSDILTLAAVVQALEDAGCELYEETFIRSEAHAHP